ncbi:hypothetical protein PINS_up005672 [Pythium insidiosum]|nr:hypothetical protein PINS_up005672 [Pythium insidiosum]
MNLPTYFDVVRTPMDLSTMASKLATHQYASPEDYRADLVLMCENAIEFNKDDDHEDSVCEMAKRMLRFGLSEWEKEFSEDATTDWQQVAWERFREQMLDRAREAKLRQRWKPDSFVARMNREKKEQRQALHGLTEPHLAA